MKYPFLTLLALFSIEFALSAAALPSPVAVWDGDFSTAAKGLWTLSLKNGSPLPTSAGNLALSANALKLTSANTKYVNGAIVVRYSGYTANSLDNTALSAAYVGSGYGNGYESGCEANGGILRTYYDTVVNRPLTTQIGPYTKDNVAIPPSGYMILAYSADTGTAAFFADMNKDKWKGGCDSGMCWSGKTVDGFSVGGPWRNSPASTMGPCATMTIEAVAVFEDYNGLDESGVAGLMAYEFPSEIAPLAVWKGVFTDADARGSVTLSLNGASAVSGGVRVGSKPVKATCDSDLAAWTAIAIVTDATGTHAWGQSYTDEKGSLLCYDGAYWTKSGLKDSSVYSGRAFTFGGTNDGTTASHVQTGMILNGMVLFDSRLDANELTTWCSAPVPTLTSGKHVEISADATVSASVRPLTVEVKSASALTFESGATLTTSGGFFANAATTIVAPADGVAQIGGPIYGDLRVASGTLRLVAHFAGQEDRKTSRIELGANAVVQVGTDRGYTFLGAGTVDVTLTQDEYHKGGELVCFTNAVDSTTTVGKVYMPDGTTEITDKVTIDGNKITITHVAKIGDVYYLTLQDAFNAAEADDEIVLVANVALDACIEVDKAVTLNIGAFNVTPKAKFTTGTVDALFVVNYGGDFTVNGTKGTIDSSSQSSVWAVIKMTEKGDVYDGTTRAKLTVNANLTGYYYAICGNGGCPGTDITINGGTITAVAEGDNQGIFNPQSDSTVTINGGTIKGYSSAIEMRGGLLTVNGGTLESTSETYSVTASGSGTTTIGAAIAIAQHTTQKTVDVTINGGTITGASKSVSVANPQNNPAASMANVSLALNGGTYKGALEVAANAGDASVTKVASLEIDPPVGYAWDNGKLQKAVAKVGTTYYLTLADAITNQTSAATIELVADVTAAGAITVKTAITLEGGTNILENATFTFDGGTITFNSGCIGIGYKEGMNPASGICRFNSTVQESWTGHGPTDYSMATLSTPVRTGTTYQYEFVKSGFVPASDEVLMPVANVDGTDAGAIKLKSTWVEKVTDKSTASEQAVVLNTKQNNNLMTWENAVLGLDGSKAESKPVVAPVQDTSTEKITFKLGGCAVDTDSGATVTYKVLSASSPSAESWKTEVSDVAHSDPASVDLPKSGVKYYKFEVITATSK